MYRVVPCTGFKANSQPPIFILFVLQCSLYYFQHSAIVAISSYRDVPDWNLRIFHSDDNTQTQRSQYSPSQCSTYMDRPLPIVVIQHGILHIDYSLLHSEFRLNRGRRGLQSLPWTKFEFVNLIGKEVHGCGNIPVS